MSDKSVMSDEVIMQYGHRMASKYRHSWDGPAGHRYEFQPHTLIQFARAVADAAIAADRAAIAEPVRHWVLIDPVERAIKMDSSDGSMMFFGSQKEAALAANRYAGCAVHPVVYYTAPPAAPDGYVLVPVEPTDAVVTALCKAKNKTACPFAMFTDEEYRSFYRAMLAAAHAPSQEPKP